MAGHACALGWQCPQRLASRQSSDKSPLRQWLGHLVGTALGSRVPVYRGNKGHTEAPSHGAPPSSPPAPGTWFVFGTWKGEGFHRSSWFTIKCLKSTASEEGGTNTTHFGIQTPRQRQMQAEQTPYHAPTHPHTRTGGPPTATLT